MRKAILNHGYIALPDYELGDCKPLENMLSTWDDVTHTSTGIGYFYEEEKRELRVPAGIGVNTIAKITNREPDVNYESDEPRKAIINLKVEPRDLSQKHFLSFLAGQGAYECNAKYSQICLIAGTGEGKTYAAIAAISFLRMVPIFITNSSTLRKQWAGKATQYTNLQESGGLIIDSTTKIERLMEQTKPIKYVFFSATHDVIESYAKKHGWEQVHEFFKKIGVGVTVIDEAHRYFGNTVKILTHTNSKKYFLLTATFRLSDYKRNKIFYMCFRSIPVYNQSEREGGMDSQKHITGIMVIYDSNPSLAMELSLDGRKGLDGHKYCNYLAKTDMDFLNLLGIYLTHMAVNLKLKTFIFCGTIDACDIVANYARNVCKDKIVGVYNSKVKVKPDEKEKIKECSDIVVTTSKSLGEGADVYGLHCIIDFEAYRTDVAAEQNPGRMRKIDEHNFYYIKIVNKGIKKAFNQYKEVKKVFSKNFGKIKVFDYTKRK